MPSQTVNSPNEASDETEYLNASQVNKKRLDESIKELESGKGTKISLEDLWK